MKKVNNATAVLDAALVQANHLNKVRESLFTAIAVPMAVLNPKTFYEGQKTPFDAPVDSFGVYKVTGGECLGVVGKVFHPLNLNLLMDVIEQAVANCEVPIDLTKLTFDEIGGGRKVIFNLPLADRVIQSPQIGDILSTKIQIKTGFDGLTKLSMGFMTKRLWCLNGASSWKQDVNMAVRNTEKNQFNMMAICANLIGMVENVDTYVEQLGALSKKKTTKVKLQGFLSELLGFDVTTAVADMHPKRLEVLREVTECIDIEIANTGFTEFSLLQGVTRFATHKKAAFGALGEEGELLYGTAASYNKRAHELLIPA